MKMSLPGLTGQSRNKELDSPIKSWNDRIIINEPPRRRDGGVSKK